MDSFNHTWLKIEKVAIVEERARQGRELQKCQFVPNRTLN